MAESCPRQGGDFNGAILRWAQDHLRKDLGRAYPRALPSLLSHACAIAAGLRSAWLLDAVSSHGCPAALVHELVTEVSSLLGFDGKNVRLFRVSLQQDSCPQHEVPDPADEWTRVTPKKAKSARKTCQREETSSRHTQNFLCHLPTLLNRLEDDLSHKLDGYLLLNVAGNLKGPVQVEPASFMAQARLREWRKVVDFLKVALLRDDGQVLDHVSEDPVSLTGWLLGYPVLYAFPGDGASQQGNCLGGVPLTITRISTLFTFEDFEEDLTLLQYSCPSTFNSVGRIARARLERCREKCPLKDFFAPLRVTETEAALDFVSL